MRGNLMKITKKLMEKIEKSPKVYLVACWARWGVREYHWTDELPTTKVVGFPLNNFYRS